MAELNLSGMRQGYEGYSDFYEEVMAAIDLASDQDTITYLAYEGRRIAAIVPVNVAEHHLGCMGEVLEPVSQAAAVALRPPSAPCPECGVSPCKMDCSRRQP